MQEHNSQTVLPQTGTDGIHQWKTKEPQTNRVLTTIIESAPTALVMIDADGTIQLVNKETERLFGFHRDELLCQSVEMLLPERFRHHHPLQRAGFFASPEARRMGEGRELFGRKKDGSEFPIEIGLNPIETDEQTFVLSAIVDISERRRLETRLRAVIESSPTGMAVVDASGKIILVNSETERMFGYPRNQLIGKQVEDLIPDRFRTNHPDLRKGFSQSPSARKMGDDRELFGLRSDGSEFPIEIGLNPFETEEGQFVMSAIVDITERSMQRMRELSAHAIALERSNSALERSNLELQQFAYVASHDLQSPLRNINGFVQLLAEQYNDRLDEQGKRWIGRTVDSIGQMQTLIQDLLSYSRVDQRSRPFEPVELQRVVVEAQALLDSSIQDSKAKIILSDLPCVVGDKSQLVQLLQNLIGNGIKYNANPEPIVTISSKDLGDFWELEIKDNGIGIAEKYHRQIFEIFRRLHSQSEYPGTGIGLAICRKVVERHGGDLRIESTVGQGSSFYITLPKLSGTEDRNSDLKINSDV